MNKMKQILLASLFTLSLLPISAQTDSSAVANGDLRQTVDSLTRIVAELKQNQEEMKHEQHLDRVWGRKSLMGISWVVSQTLTDKTTDNEWEQEFAIGLQWGKTYYLHRKPIAGMIKFGIDWNWTDVTYAKYKNPLEDMANAPTPYYEEGDDLFTDIDLGMQQIDYGMAIGPSITVNPVGHLKAAAYFHYIPTGSMVLMDSEISAAYVGNMAWGMTVSHKAFFVGFESRWGTGKYGKFDIDDLDEDLGYDDATGEVDVPGFNNLFKDKNKMKTKSFRLSFGFRW